MQSEARSPSPDAAWLKAENGGQFAFLGVAGVRDLAKS
jgi:hypothetical protein